MPKAITIMSDQIPTSAPGASFMTWNCEDWIISYDRRTRVLTVEEFEGFDEDNGGVEITTVITNPIDIGAILAKHKPGWPSAAGFTLLQSYYGDRWTIGTEPI